MRLEFPSGRNTCHVDRYALGDVETYLYYRGRELNGDFIFFATSNEYSMPPPEDLPYDDSVFTRIPPTDLFKLQGLSPCICQHDEYDHENDYFCDACDH